MKESPSTSEKLLPTITTTTSALKFSNNNSTTWSTTIVATITIVTVIQTEDGPIIIMVRTHITLMSHRDSQEHLIVDSPNKIIIMDIATLIIMACT